MTKVAFCFPGQGSLEAGMGREIAEASAPARDVYRLASGASGLDIERLCWEAPIEELVDTEVQQPALVATSLAILAALRERGLEPDVVVVWAMNGAPLSAEHGFPARVFVPGYFGTNAVKWLSRLTLTAERPQSLFTTRLYNRRVDGELQPVRELDVHAVIVQPADGTRLTRGRHAIKGWAWSHWPVRAVAVSTDGAATWQAASVAPRGADHQWQAFTYAWNLAAPGRYEVHARATDERGRVQPLTGRNRIHTISVAAA